MIQRYLYDLLKEGFDKITQDPLLIEDIFLDNFGLAESEVRAIKTFYAAHPVYIVNGYARQDNRYPVIAITLGSEGEAETVLGDDAGMIDDPDDHLYQCDVTSALWKHTYFLTVISEHPDVTAYYYEMAKPILLAGLEWLTTKGLSDFSLSGEELLLEPTYMPEHLFLRRLIFTAQRELWQPDRKSRLLKAFKVGGIAVDKSGSPSDVGGVNTNVIPYLDDGDESDAGDQS
jgi:hypothetical protein